MEKTLKVNVIKHADVRGRELMYLAIEDLLINVGTKTYESVKTLLEKQDDQEQKVKEPTKEKKVA